jgi:hypothetical protein
MKSSRSSDPERLLVLGKVVKAAALGLVGAVIFGVAVVIGYQAEKQVSR